jgi:hypothetical protein
MKYTASTKTSSNVRGSSTRPRNAAASGRRFAVCVDNDGYEVSLERNKIYAVLPDEDAAKDGNIRVVDQRGEATCRGRS